MVSVQMVGKTEQLVDHLRVTKKLVTGQQKMQQVLLHVCNSAVQIPSGVQILRRMAKYTVNTKQTDATNVKMDTILILVQDGTKIAKTLQSYPGKVLI